MLEIEDLKVYFNTSRGTVKAVDEVSVNIKINEIVGLVGESGCGKSTLGLSILRLVPPPGEILGGRIVFDGTNLAELSTKEMRGIRGRAISAIFQDPMTYMNPVFKIKKQIAEPIILHQKVPKREAEKRAVELLKTLQIADPEEVSESYPHQLSGGMLQRCLIAIALSCKPRLLVADEPTTALDVTVQAQILNLLLRLRAEFGMSILLVTHDLGIVSEVCDRVYVMYAGKIVEYGEVFSVFDNPMHPYTKGLLSSVLSIDEFKETLVAIGGSVPSLIDPPLGCRFHTRCSYAMDLCKRKSPEMFEPEKNHSVACWLYKGG